MRLQISSNSPKLSIDNYYLYEKFDVTKHSSSKFLLALKSKLFAVVVGMPKHLLKGQHYDALGLSKYLKAKLR